MSVTTRATTSPTTPSSPDATPSAVRARTSARTRPRSRRDAARIAGAGYVLLFALAVFANFTVFEQLVVPGDAAATTANLAAEPTLFRLAIVAFLVVFVVDVVVAWALHLLFRDVDRDASLLAAWLRLVYTVFLGAALVFAVQALELATAPVLVDALDPAAREAQVLLAMGAFDTAWLVGLAAFGLHLVLLGRLVVRSGEASRLLGWLLVVAGTAYVVDTIARLVVADYEAVAMAMLALVAVPSVVAEGWTAVWLLRRAGRADDGGTAVEALPA